MYNNRMLRIEKSYTIEKHEKTMQVQDYYENFVDLEKTIQSCKKCDKYGKCWSCPPFNEDISDYWKKYENIDLILLQLHYDNTITEEIFSQEDIDTLLHLTLFNEKTKLLQSLTKKTRKNEEFDDSMILSTGYCNLCPVCTKIDNQPCRYPKNKLYSIESIGGLVTKTTEELFDKKIKWIDMEKGKIPDYLTLLMGILY
ncbi:MAG: hypothetical protein BZ135_08040 [Methanosphaera sp. rholeuAM6]|nr:MAG: hypothetical protein BZ135_08040 [Methanosphaera sp. rholeuAM6]